ncbi:MAG: histidinol-phosphate transaminase [Myxococcota bacterium]
MLKLVNDAYETLTPYVPGKPVSETERELGLTGVVKLASNENPLGPSPKAVQAMADRLKEMHDYPDGGAYHLKAAIARFHDVPPEQIIVGNGTNEVLELLVRTILRPGEKVLFADPSFIVYKLATKACGRELISVPLKDMRFDLPAMAAAVDDATKLVFIANPNNPTGTYVTREEFEAFLEAIPEDVLVVMDEAYAEYVNAEDCPDGFDYLGRRHRYMVTRTFSKCYGLAGLRIGYGIAEPELIDFLNRGRQPFNTNALAQAAAVAALEDQDHVKAAVELNRREMNRLVPLLEDRGLTVVPSQANFLLVDFKRDGAELYERFLRAGVILRPMGGYGLPTHMRVTIGTESMNDAFLNALNKVL